MKLRGLLLLLLLLAILLPLGSLFHSADLPEAGYVGTGSLVVVVAKESYVYARLQIVVQPMENGPQGIPEASGAATQGLVQPTEFTFPNGTSVAVTQTTTFTIILSNNAFIGESVSWETGQISVSPGSPLSISVLNGQNATSSSAVLGQPNGIDVFEYRVSGDYDLSAQALGVSL